MNLQTGQRVIITTASETATAPIGATGYIDQIGTVIRVRMDEPCSDYWGGNQDLQWFDPAELTVIPVSIDPDAVVSDTTAAEAMVA